jgi:hypothetical protein
MDDRLFEKYCRGTLTAAEKRRLMRRLKSPSASREFAAFVLGWDLIGELALRREAAARRLPRVAP